MAVVSMQKVQAVVHQHDVDAFLTCMQKFGVMEFTEVENKDLSQISATAPHAELLPRVQHATQFLQAYETKRGLWKTLREGSTTDCDEGNINKRIADTEAVNAVVCDVQALQVEMAQKTECVRHLDEQRDLLKAFSPITNKLSQLDTDSTSSILVAQAADSKVSLQEEIKTALPEEVVAMGVESVSKSSALVTFSKSDVALAENAFQSSDLQIVARPEGVETAVVELAAVEEKLAAAKGELGIVHDQAEHAAHSYLKDLRLTEEVLTWEQDRYATLDNGKSTQSTSVFAGWLMADRRGAVESELKEKNVAATFTELALEADEEPPVEIENNGFFKPFEVVTRLYGMPGYKDLDPTLFMAGFFFLFFGLALTDVGYGVFLMAVATMFLTLFKVSPSVRMFMKLLLFMGLASALVGLLFGGYLGIAPESIPDWLKAIQVFDPIGDPLPVFYLALGLGVFQVIVGILLKIYSESRNGNLLNGVLDQGPWLFLFDIGILAVGVTTGYVEFITTDVLTKLAYLGVVLVALSSGRKGKGILGKAMSALGALYNDGIGYFSDVLSYSRLLALGLATSALAFAVNLIAELVSGTPYVGPILAVAVVIIGHVFALAINTLGAFIHSARLQFIEFFGKFLSGAGRVFSPLTRSSRYITAREE